MAAKNHSSRGLEDVKVDIEQKELAVSDQDGPISAYEIQGRFDTLRDLTTTQMDELNVRVRRKVDWRLMPTITIMFLMKLVSSTPHFPHVFIP